MRVARALTFGVIGAAAMSALSALLRVAGIPIKMELILGTLTGMSPGPAALALGLAIHLAIGAAFGLLYGWLFERVWNHGGASTGVILGLIHATLLGILFGLTPQFHPHIPGSVTAPGPYFAASGVTAVLAFFALHMVYGAVVGAGYGHPASEREWAPAGRL